MKSYNHLFEQVIEKENIKAAMLSSSKKKRDKESVIKAFENVDDTIDYVTKILVEENYSVMYKHNSKIIKDGISKKIRKVTIPTYNPEQIIHHAVMNVIEPIIYKGFYEYTCGSIPGRGGLHGKKYLEKYIKNNTSNVKYFVKLDIRHFYPSINHELLKILISKHIHDAKFLRLIYAIIDSYSDGKKYMRVDEYMAKEITKAYRLAGIECDELYDGKLIEVEYGIPIGFFTSQWFANWYLSEFDHYVKQELGIPCYVRYVDDMVLFTPNKRILTRSIEQILSYMDCLDLTIKPNFEIKRFHYISKNGKEKGSCLDFLGYRFFRDRTILRKHILLKSKRKAAVIYKKGRSVTWYDSTQMLSLCGYFDHSDHSKFYGRNIKPYINKKLLKRYVSEHSKKECINQGNLLISNLQD